MIPRAQLKEIAGKCVKCGICQSVCPMFAELQHEGAVARGKVTLIRRLFSEEIRYSPKLSTYLLQCLGCGACSENCPNGVEADELILAARVLMVEKKGLSLPKWIILRQILDSVYLLPVLLRTGSLLKRLVLRKVPGESGLHLRFSLPYLDKHRLIPSITTPFLVNRYPDGTQIAGVQKKVGLFAGCSINYLFPSIGESAIGLLTRSNFSVALPKEQTCCGLPAYGSGDIETATSLARKNIKTFAHPDIDQILVPCASCFYFLKACYLTLLPKDREAIAFSQKVVEPSGFFLNLFASSRIRNRAFHVRNSLRLGYHDPCHLRRGMKIYQEPRRLLQSLPEIEFVELQEPDRCCGMGGSFNLIYYDLSKRIMQRKLDQIQAANVEFVATSCMGCIMQLRDGMHQRKMKTRVVHLIEVLEKAMNSRIADLRLDSP